MHWVALCCGSPSSGRVGGCTEVMLEDVLAKWTGQSWFFISWFKTHRLGRIGVVFHSSLVAACVAAHRFLQWHVFWHISVYAWWVVCSAFYKGHKFHYRFLKVLEACITAYHLWCGGRRSKGRKEWMSKQRIILNVIRSSICRVDSKGQHLLRTIAPVSGSADSIKASSGAEPGQAEISFPTGSSV